MLRSSSAPAARGIHGVERVHIYLRPLGQEILIDFGICLRLCRRLSRGLSGGAIHVAGFFLGREALVFIAQRGAIGVDHEHSEQWPLEGIAQVLEGARAGAEARPLPIGQE